MSFGGLMKLVAFGAQDAYLTGKPEITFFKTEFKKHTQFAPSNNDLESTGKCYQENQKDDKDKKDKEYKKYGEIMFEICANMENEKTIYREIESQIKIMDNGDIIIKIEI